MNEEGVEIGLFKVRSLLIEKGLVSKQTSPHKYKKATIEHVDIPNKLSREFTVSAPDKVWCCDTVYICAGNRGLYVAAAIDIYARRVVGWAISGNPIAKFVLKALDTA